MGAVVTASHLPPKAVSPRSAGSGGARSPASIAGDAGAIGVRTPPALEGSLRQLMVLRGIACGGQALVIAATSVLGVDLPLAPMLSVIAALVALNAATWLRLRRPVAVGHGEIAGHLALDLVAFSLLVALSGGTTNPFSLVYALHAVLAALLLPPRLAMAGTLLVIAGYTAVAAFHRPLLLESGGPPTPSVMAVGAWAGLAITAGVSAWFVARIVAVSREHERALREAAQRAMNDEAILKLGTLAAGAAHELATPLTTMAVVVGEMEREAGTPSLRRDAGILSAQVSACRRTIATLLASGGHARAEGGRVRLDAFLQGIARRFEAMRPDAGFTWRIDGASAPSVLAEQSLAQAIIALLDNAADASPGEVALSARWDDDTLSVAIEDRGAGVPAADLNRLGREFFTTKAPGKGTGLGLVLASNAIKFLGGCVRWQARAGGGTRVDVAVPLRTLALAEVPMTHDDRRMT